MYIGESQKKSDLDRGDLNKNKTGVFLGSYAINPVNGEKIPVWVADYVLMNYGTGAIMAVPGHDERDYQFAIKYGLPIIEVVSGGDINTEAYTDNINGKMVNSSNDYGLDLNDMFVPEAIKTTISWLSKNNKGKGKIQYKLRDWLFSRQRYWGEPIPVVHTNDGKIIPLDDTELPSDLASSRQIRTCPDGRISTSEHKGVGRNKRWEERDQYNATVGGVLLVLFTLYRSKQQKFAMGQRKGVILDARGSLHRRS